MRNDNGGEKKGARPTIGVILPNYNHSTLIGRAIDAIAGQTRPPDQLIIVDDGSTDGSVAVIEKHIAGLDFVDFIKMPENTRLEGARSKAFEALRTDYVYNTAADDFILPEFFERVMDMAERYPEAGLIFGNFVCHDEAGNVIFRAEPPLWREALFADPGRFQREFLDQSDPNHSQSGATVYRTEALFAALPYRKELHTWKDTFNFWNIALQHGCCYVPCDAMAWNLQGGGLSQQTSRNLRKMIDISARGAWLMRSEEFAGLHDPEFVSKWSREFRRKAVEAHMAQLGKAFDEFRASLGLEGPGGLFWNDVDRHMLRGVFNLTRGAYLLAVRAMIGVYRGDVSCFESRRETCWHKWGRCLSRTVVS